MGGCSCSLLGFGMVRGVESSYVGCWTVADDFARDPGSCFWRDLHSKQISVLSWSRYSGPICCCDELKGL